MYPFLTIVKGSFISSFFVAFYWLIIVIVSIRVLSKRKSTSYVVAWLLVIHLIPFLGIFLYLLFGEIHLGQKRAQRAKEINPKLAHFIVQLTKFSHIFTQDVSPVAKRIFQLYHHQTQLGGVIGNEIQLLDDSDHVFKQLVEDINQANSHIEMTFYIWATGGNADKVQEALIAAAQRGVSCKIMLDSAGSRAFFKNKANLKKLKDAGVVIVESLKVNIFRFLFRRLDLRQHRKMVIIDNLISYTGSMNLVDPRFFKQDKNVGEWVDMMVRMKGPISSMMRAVHASDWLLETGQFLELPQITDYMNPDKSQKHIIQLIPSGPGYTENILHQTLLTSIYSAEKEIIFTTPYLVPSDDLVYAISTAAQRGVDVKIIVPQKGDSLMANWAGRAFYAELLNSGVKIFQFQNNLLHSKSVLVDNQLSLVGTVNLDMRSLWLNFELTAIIDDTTFAKELKTLLNGYIDNSIEISKIEWKKRPLWNHWIERIFYFFSPLL